MLNKLKMKEFFFSSGIWFCGFASLGYGTVMYVWMMEHVSGTVGIKVWQRVSDRHKGLMQSLK